MVLENEVKLDVNLDFTPPAISVGGGITHIELLPVKRTVTVYFDLANDELAEENIALRFRYQVNSGELLNVGDFITPEGMQAGIWAVKTGGEMLQSDGVTSVSREELEVKGDFGLLPTEISEPFPLLKESRSKLKIIAGLEARRNTSNIFADSIRLIEIDDDVVEVLVGATRGDRFREIEMELIDREGALVRSAIVKDYLRAGARYASAASKLERALGR